MSTLGQQQGQVLQRLADSAPSAPQPSKLPQPRTLAARVANSRWIVAALVTISAASVLWAWPDLWPTRSPSDPVVDFRTSANGVLTTTATFAPRVGLPGTVEYAHTFVLRNEGGSDLVIERTSKSCGCLSATIDREVVPTGETAAVTLKVRPNNVVNKEGTLTVWAKDGRRFVYRLRTWTYPPVMLEGASNAPISFGLLAPGSRTTTVRRLYVHSEASSVPPELRCGNVDGESPIRCALVDRGVTPIADGPLLRRTYELTVEVAAASAPGLKFDVLEFLPRDATHADYAFKSNVTWNVESPILLEPARWIVKRAEMSSMEPLSRSVRLSHSEGMPFHITSIEASEAWLQTTLPSLDTSESCELNITVDPAQVPADGSSLATLNIQVQYDTANGSANTEQQFRVVVTN